jgi:hypothetical protein
MSNKIIKIPQTIPSYAHPCPIKVLHLYMLDVPFPVL